MRGLQTPALIESWFDLLVPVQQPHSRALQRLVLQAAPVLTQCIKWGNLVFSAQGRHLLALVPHKTHVNLQLFNGASLAERFAALEGNGRGLRHLKCRYSEALDEPLVLMLVGEALALPPPSPDPRDAHELRS